ncbi:MAG: YfiR family protein, partial [Ferruginibacter sp.]
VAEIDDCHILFIAQKETVEIQNVLEYVNNRSTLTVGDAANFTTIGGMIAFITVHNKIRFQVNVKATKAAELVISSKLLRLAEIENRLL